MMMEVKVGANSRMTDCRVAKAIRLLGKSGLVRFRAVCMVTTAPIKKETKTMIPMEPYINSAISLRIKDLRIGYFVGFLNTSQIMVKYFPIATICIIGSIRAFRDKKKNIVGHLTFNYSLKK